MRKVITGEQVAQLSNRDPFALPVWRAPVYRTPAGIVLLVQLDPHHADRAAPGARAG